MVCNISYFIFISVLVCLFLSYESKEGVEYDQRSVADRNTESANVVHFSVISSDEVVNFNESADGGCDCGPESTKCEMKDGLKICTCQDGFVPGINEVCTKQCDDTNKCQNGGTCHKGICMCPRRTEGPFCEYITVRCGHPEFENFEEAAGHRGLGCCCIASKTSQLCKYDVKKYDAYCECPKKDEVYDDNSNSCKECNCGKFDTWKKCEFINGVKTCYCKKDFEYNPKTKICEPCQCGDNSKKCEFSWTGSVKCNCMKHYTQWNNKCVKCDCGEKGYCELRDGKPICHCDIGAQIVNGNCVGCDCGKFGTCVYDEKGKKLKCDCDFGYTEVDGKCEFCYCGDFSNCTLDSERNKTCNCSQGYRPVNGFCTDIDECEEQANLCPSNEKCINFPGTFICGCGNGYTHTSNGCTDIDECLTRDICGGKDKECINTPGSFECRCKSGYLSRGGPKASLICQDNSASKIGYGILGALFSLIIIGLIAILYKKYRSS